MTTNTTPKCDTSPKIETLPPWRVILHNDDVNTANAVAERVHEITPLNEQDAVLRVKEADETGQSLLLTTHRERAELYVEQFETFMITVTAEKM